MSEGKDVVAALLKQLEDTERMAWDIDRSLEALSNDAKAEDDGWSFSLVIDCSELHRYLHPYVDRQRDDREKFVMAQLVLSYLFDVSDRDFLLLPVYHEELKHHLIEMSSEFEALLKQEYKTTRQKELGEFMEKLKVAEDSSRLDVEIFHKYSLEILLKENVKIRLMRAMDRYRDLVTKGKIYFLEQLKDVRLHKIKIDRLSPEFIEIFGDMRRLRSEVERFLPNIHDSDAVLWVKKANEITSADKKAFLLVSSSPRILPAFRKVKSFVTRDGNQLETTIVRDLYYFLFQYYFCVENCPNEEILSRIANTRDLFQDYIKRMEGLHAKAWELSLKDLDQSQIIPLYRRVMEKLWEFETFIAKRIEFEPVKPLDDAKTIDTIVQLAKNEEVFRDSVNYALKGLRDSINVIDDVYKQILQISETNQSRRGVESVV